MTMAPNEMDPYAASHIYYGKDTHDASKMFRPRTYSTNQSTNTEKSGLRLLVRRSSHGRLSCFPQEKNPFPHYFQMSFLYFRIASF
ncbi:BgTH12-07849 [Blumeria graminis f. sp. triticale]|uniref:Bgt-4835 n=3 Tax=Blumeria graminis TaxID=34373 RepID=A0A061HFY6_BLUGR|nr:Neutral trehalase [Blumeria graminis f. sp. tritici 96224]CAD6500680.1 BgTH12-06388 [Blumeria graminis f. sp. triticale]CAD6506623.1 BgTH12-07849 [Blumeria graminis f. sp. triticale]VCU40955.1 Bgt-4835 [Blumeria graminis f. sp. tritici]